MKPMAEPVTDEHLAHLCKLATVAAYPLLQSREEWVAYMQEADETELWNNFSALSILAKAFLALLDKHPELRPSFRVRATSEAEP
jgi:hypothetical protein